MDEEMKMAEKYKPEGQTIKWDGPGTGLMVNMNGGGSRIYSRSIGIQQVLRASAVQTIQYPRQWAEGKIRYYGGGMFDVLDSCIPRFWNRDKVIKLVEAAVPSILSAVERISPTSDLAFLAKIGLKRDWKRECCICLKDKNIGTMCLCGHTEIVVFRPCGHAVCAQPCFIDLIKIVPKEFTTKDGRRFTRSINFNIVNPPCLCPICRQSIDSTFKAEDVFVPKILELDDVIATTATAIIQSL
jgi:hypothetical protein